MTGFFESGSQMTCRQFADRLKVSTDVVRQWVHKGKLKPRRFGTALVFTEDDVVTAEKMREAMTQGRRTDRIASPATGPASAYCTIEQAAVRLGCSTRTVARRITDGELHPHSGDRPGTLLLRSEVEALKASEDGVGAQAVA